MDDAFLESGDGRRKKATLVLAGEGRRSALSWRRAIFLLDSGIQASASLPSFHLLGPFSTFRLSSPSITAPSSLPACQAMVSSRGWRCQNPGHQLSWALPAEGDRNKRGGESLKVARHREVVPIGRESALAGGHRTSLGHKTWAVVCGSGPYLRWGALTEGTPAPHQLTCLLQNLGAVCPGLSDLRQSSPLRRGSEQLGEATGPPGRAAGILGILCSGREPFPG